MLHGNTIFEFARERKVNNRIKREVVKRIEKHNAITPWVQNVIKQGNFNMSIPNSVIMPLSQWFDGCVLTSGQNDPTLGMIAYNSNVVACAGNSADSGSTDLRRGALNVNETADITGGRRFVWDWGTDRGNGIIASVGLTRSSLAIAEISKEAIPTGNFYNLPLFVTNNGNMNASYLNFGRCQIIDYEKEKAYYIYYSNGVVIAEYDLSTKRIQLLDTPFALRKGYDGNYVVTSHSIPNSTISNPSPAFNNSSIGYTGSHIHFVVWSGATIKDYVINTSTWELDSSYGTGGVITRTFTGVTFTNIFVYTPWNYYFKKDVYPIVGDYIWTFGTVSNVPKILKCNLLGSSATEIFEFDNPYYTKASVAAGSMTSYNGASVILPNGDIVKRMSKNDVSVVNNSQPCLLIHNDEIYLSRVRMYSSGDSSKDVGINSNGYGTQIVNKAESETGVGILELCSGFISTCNNLDEAVTKSADLTMKLTYEITEVDA